MPVIFIHMDWLTKSRTKLDFDNEATSKLCQLSIHGFFIITHSFLLVVTEININQWKKDVSLCACLLHENRRQQWKFPWKVNTQLYVCLSLTSLNVSQCLNNYFLLFPFYQLITIEFLGKYLKLGFSKESGIFLPIENLMKKCDMHLMLFNVIVNTDIYEINFGNII